MQIMKNKGISDSGLGDKKSEVIINKGDMRSLFCWDRMQNDQWQTIETCSILLKLFIGWILHGTVTKNVNLNSFIHLIHVLENDRGHHVFRNNFPKSFIWGNCWLSVIWVDWLLGLRVARSECQQLTVINQRPAKTDMKARGEKDTYGNNNSAVLTWPVTHTIH